MRCLPKVLHLLFMCRRCCRSSSTSTAGSFDAQQAPQQHATLTPPSYTLLPQKPISSSEESLSQLRGGSKFTRRSFSRKKAWETAVKRGKGGFPGPMSWEPMDEEELRAKAESLLTPEVRGYVARKACRLTRCISRY